MIKGLPISLKRLYQLGQVLILIALCVVLAVGCNRDTDNNTNEPIHSNRDRLTFGTVLKPRTLDPADSYEVGGLMLIYNLGETLYTYELGTTQLKPQLATEIPKISQDGLTYTIPLRQGVKFHDGSDFDAKAMVFSLQRFVTMGGSPSFLLADTLDTIEVTKGNNYEIRIKLKKPFAAFPALLAFPGTCAVSPKAYKIEPEPEKLAFGEFKPNKFVGTGPYQLAEFSSDTIRLDRFEEYWGKKAQNKGIDLQIYPSNPANLFNAFRTGAVDVAYQSLLPQQIKQLKTEASQGKGQVIEASGSAVTFMALKVQSEPLNNLKVRQAIATLIDRKLLIDRILQGQGESLYSLIPKTFAEYKPVFLEAYGDGDSEKAKEFLQQAGYSPENPVTVEVWHSSGSVTSSMVASILKALAKRDLGGVIKFEPNSIASAAFFRNIGQGLYETAISNWSPDFLDADNYIYPFLDCAKGSDTGGCKEGGAQSQGSFYYSERMNKLIDQQRQEINPTTRKTIFAEIQKLLADSVPYIPLWQSKDYAFAQNGIKGVTINPSQTFPFWTIHRS